MGDTTQAAKDRFSRAYTATNPWTIGNMDGTVAVWDPNLNQHFAWYDSTKGGFHLEEKLIGKIHDQFGDGLENLFNGAIIVFYCAWSPCKYCARTVIPNFMVKLIKRKIDVRVRLRFANYYALGVAKTHNQYLWESAADAQEDYDNRMKAFGYRFVRYDGPSGEYHTKYYLTIMSNTAEGSVVKSSTAPRRIGL
jgi:hypothetical protein